MERSWILLFFAAFAALVALEPAAAQTSAGPRPFSSIGFRSFPGSNQGRPFSNIGSSRAMSSLGTDRPMGELGTGRPFGRLGSDPEIFAPGPMSPGNDVDRDFPAGPRVVRFAPFRWRAEPWQDSSWQTIPLSEQEGGITLRALDSSTLMLGRVDRALRRPVLQIKDSLRREIRQALELGQFELTQTLLDSPLLRRDWSEVDRWHQTLWFAGTGQLHDAETSALEFVDGGFLAIQSREAFIPDAVVDRVQRHLKVRSDEPAALFLDAFLASCRNDWQKAKVSLQALLLIDPHHPALPALEQKVLAATR